MLAPGSAIIEATSGNTGVSLAMVAAARCYRCIIVMPESMSIERRRLLAAYGAQVILTPAEEGMACAIRRAEEVHRSTPGSILANQFSNPANPAAHAATTGPEIWADTAGRVDAFVAGIGTGGTVTGVGRYLKGRNSAIRIVGVEPADSPLLTQGCTGLHPLQGIGPNFIPEILDLVARKASAKLGRPIRVTLADQSTGNGNYHSNQYNNRPGMMRPKSRIMAGVLALVYGSFGIHNFY
jgi:cysteine synthase A